MELKEIALESVDFDDQRYRISESLPSAAIERSLQEIGQTCPVILLRGSGARHTVVCGFRRIHALRKIGRREVLAWFPDVSGRNCLDIFRTALFDNLSHRQLNPLEKARVLHTLRHCCGVEPDTLVESYLPLLELAPHRNVLRIYLQLHLLLPELRPLLLEGKLTSASAERLCRGSIQDQSAMAVLFEKGRWSASLQRQLLDLVEELVAVGSCGATEVLGGEEITRILNDPCLSEFQRGAQVYEILFRRRNPQLTRARREFLNEKQKLDLPGAVRLVPEPFFETSRLRVEFEADSAECLREIVDALHHASRAPALDRLFRVT